MLFEFTNDIVVNGIVNKYKYLRSLLKSHAVWDVAFPSTILYIHGSSRQAFFSLDQVETI